MPASPKVTFSSVQAGRGLAASSVVLFHVSEIIRLPKYWHSDLYHRIFLFGSYGVYFFFVLSGFIIMWAHQDDIGISSRVGPYFAKRIIRIYPPYWIASTVLLIISLAIHTSASHVAQSGIALAESFVLFGRDAISILPVGWTLFHEVLFYCVFSTLIIQRKVGIVIVSIWFCLCTLLYFQHFYWTSYINLEFLAGMSPSWLIKNKTIPAPWLMMISGAILFLVGALLTSDERYLTILYGIASLLLLIGGIQLERSGAIRIPSAMTFLGNASYSVYLVHFALISAGAKILMLNDVGALTAGPVLVAIGIGGGVVFHLLIEKPLSAALRREWRVRVPAS